jgi:predicted ester cyclase
MPSPVDVPGLLALWTDPLPADDTAAVAAFARFYTDPVVVNGAAMPLTGLIARARAMQATYADRHTTILDTVTTEDRLVVAFELDLRHVGPLETPLGTVAASGRRIRTRAIDVLTVGADARISEVRVVSDDLGTLTQLDAVRLS